MPRVILRLGKESQIGVCIKEEINWLIFNDLGWYYFFLSIIIPDHFGREYYSLE